MKRFGSFNIFSLIVGFSFLYIPIILLILFSFNESRLVTVWGGFSTKWYGELMQNQGIKDAAWVTIKVAFVSSTIATILGTIAGLVMTRFGNFKGRTLFFRNDLCANGYARSNHWAINSTDVCSACN